MANGNDDETNIDGGSISYDPNVSPLTDKELNGFIDLVHDICGIRLTQAKRHMVSARLHKRLRKLGFTSYGQYFKYLRSEEGQESEMQELINAITTNKTEFFRENQHFEILARYVLPEIHNRIMKPIKIWSAGCSSGEEPYTIAMVASEYFGGSCSSFDITATDISERVLDEAKDAIYNKDDIKLIPHNLLVKYMLQGSGTKRGLYKVAPELRHAVHFRSLNFMDGYYDVGGPFDIIFCRNVLIYFDRPTVAAIISKFYNLLTPGGYFFIGHSETLNGIETKFEKSHPMVFKKPL